MTDVALTGDVPEGRVAGHLSGRWPLLRRRLHAWWEGIELPSERPIQPNQRTASAAQPAEDPPETPEELARIWAPRRIDAAELIWGEDFIAPGGAEYAVNLAKPLALTPAMSILDLGVGLGGGTRALAETFGVWVSGLERDSDLVTECNNRSKNLAVEKKAPVRGFDPDQLDLKMQSVDCILSRELFHTVAGKKRLFGMIHAALKDHGQLLFTDYVRGPTLPGAAFAEWLGGERVLSHPATPKEMQSIMKDSGFNCRIASDSTDEYRAYILSAWSSLARKLEQGTVPRHLLPRVMEEAERWTKLMRTFDSGELRSYRFHAFRV